MNRVCDGTDPALTRYPHDQIPEVCPAPLRFTFGWRCGCPPSVCDCGLRFDDGRRLPMWPHRRY